MGTKNKPGAYDCLATLDPDEPYFLLRGSHPLSPDMVRLWVALRDRDYYSAIQTLATLADAAAGMGEADQMKLFEAIECADAMATWRGDQPVCRCRTCGVTNLDPGAERRGWATRDLCMTCKFALDRVADGQSEPGSCRPPAQTATLIETPAGNTAVIHGAFSLSQESRASIDCLVDCAAAQFSGTGDAFNPTGAEPRTPKPSND